MEPESQVISTPPPPPLAQEPGHQLLAPVWHTIFLAVLVVGFSYVGAHSASPKPGAVSQLALTAQYAVTIVFELLLLLLVWWGLRLNKNKMRDLIGGRWNTPEDFLLDVAVAAGFWVLSATVLAGLGYALGLANPSQVKEVKKLADMIAPQGGVTLALWIVVSATAGLVEEILFRGYFQRQLGALAGNIYVGMFGSAIIFGAGHGYEGTRRMVLIAVYGTLFGILAIWRKSLRPGMMAHAWHDAFAGVMLRVLSKKGGL